MPVFQRRKYNRKWIKKKKIKKNYIYIYKQEIIVGTGLPHKRGLKEGGGGGGLLVRHTVTSNTRNSKLALFLTTLPPIMDFFQNQHDCPLTNNDPLRLPGSTWSRERVLWALLQRAGPGAQCCGSVPSSSSLGSCWSSLPGPRRTGQITSPSRADERVYCHILLQNLQRNGKKKKTRSQNVKRTGQVQSFGVQTFGVQTFGVPPPHSHPHSHHPPFFLSSLYLHTFGHYRPISGDKKKKNHIGKHVTAEVQLP